MKWQIKGDKHGGEAELLVQTVNLASGFVASKYDDFFPEYTRLMQLTNAISHRLLAKSRTRKVSLFFLCENLVIKQSSTDYIILYCKRCY